MEAESGFSLGRASEITRDELKFTKFVQRLRKKFTPLFTDILKTQLILKGVITLEDWTNINQHIQYDFLQDGHFAELKKAELMEDRINALGNIESYIGTFFSKEWVQKNVLKLTQEEIDKFKPEIILISAGFDAHSRDPLSNINLESQDFYEITKQIVELANVHCAGRGI